MEIVIAEPRTIRSLTLPYEEIRIAVIGDIQYQGKDGPTDLDRLRRHIQWCLDHSCYFLGTGDYVDIFSPSNRQRKKEAALYDSAEEFMDQAATQLEKELERILAPTKGRWLGLVQGHHYYEHLDGGTSDTRLAQFLECPFLGDAAYVTLKFKKPPRAIAGNIYVAHGEGSAVTEGAIINRFKRVASGILADVYVMGHYHRRGAWPEQRLFAETSGRQKPNLNYRAHWFVLGGGWLRGYMLGHKFAGRPQGTYVEKRGLPPVQLGGPIIYLRPKIVAGMSKIDINVSP